MSKALLIDKIWKQVLTNFCNELQTTMMDKCRILDLKREIDKLTLTGAILLFTFTLSGPDLCSVQEFKLKLKDDILTLIKSAENSGQTDLKALLEEIAEKLKQDILKGVEQYGVGQNQINGGSMTLNLTELIDKKHKIRHLLGTY